MVRENATEHALCFKMHITKTKNQTKHKYGSEIVERKKNCPLMVKKSVAQFYGRKIIMAKILRRSKKILIYYSYSIY